jgi:hypothetical protein
VANLETLRPIAGNGCSRHFLVWFSSNDSFDSAEHQQVQLAGRREKSRHLISAKRADAVAYTVSEVLIDPLTFSDGMPTVCQLPSFR